jgi:hypothetical protein
MPNVPRASHSKQRASHQTRFRAHDDLDVYAETGQGASDAADQGGIDGTILPGDIPPGTLAPALYAEGLAPVRLVTELPVLPDPGYPVDTFAHLTTAVPPTLYKNTLVATVETWVKAIGPGDIQANSITAGEIHAGAIGTTELAAGAITLFDEFGRSALTPSGFTGSLADFVSGGLYNSTLNMFGAADIPDGRTTQLPFWDVSRDLIASLTAVTDAAWPSGKYLKGVPASATGEFAITSDLVSILPYQPLVAGAMLGATLGTAAARPAASVGMTFYDKDLVGLVTEWYTVVTYNVTDSAPSVYESAPILPPDNARYVSVSLTFGEYTTFNAGTDFRVGGIFLRSSPPAGAATFAFPPGLGPWTNYASAAAIPVGRAIFVPLVVSASLNATYLVLYNSDTSLSRSAEWRLYQASGESVILHEVQGMRGSATWTPSAASLKSILLKSNQALRPGTYWLGLRNTHATRTLGLAYASNPASSTTYGMPTSCGYKNSCPAFGATFDMSTLTGQQQAGWGVYLAGWSGGQPWG